MDLVVALRPLLCGDPRVADDAYSVLQHLICLGRAHESRGVVNVSIGGQDDSPLSREAMHLIRESVSKRLQRLLERVPGIDAAATSRSVSHVGGNGKRTGLSDCQGSEGNSDAPVVSLRVKLENCFEISKLDGKFQVLILHGVLYLAV
jgi:hypothetical protein